MAESNTRGPNWWLPSSPGGPPTYDVSEVCRQNGRTCPHGGMRCESIACIDFGCIATETPEGQLAMETE